jgi:hypothetical protein
MGCEVGEVWAPAPAHTKLQPYPGSYKESKQDCSDESIKNQAASIAAS